MIYYVVKKNFFANLFIEINEEVALYESNKAK